MKNAERLSVTKCISNNSVELEVMCSSDYKPEYILLTERVFPPELEVRGCSLGILYPSSISV